MTNQNPAVARRDLTLPEGWPIGAYDTYAEAQAAVNHLCEQENFPVEDLTIVGTNPVEVERIHGRLTLGRVLVSGLMTGLFFGMLLGLVGMTFSENPVALGIGGVVVGLIFGLVQGLLGYLQASRSRKFFATTRIVCQRYEVLCQPSSARTGRDLLLRLDGTNPAARAQSQAFSRRA